MTFLSEMVDRVEALTGYVEGTNVFTYELPNEPDVCVVLKDGPGQDSDQGFGQQGAMFETPSLFVTVRGARPGAGVADEVTTPAGKIDTIYRGLTRVATTLGTTFYHWIQPIGSPHYVGRDENGRRLWALSLLAKRVP